MNWLTGGGAGWVKFPPAYYNDNGPWGEYYATRVIYWNRAQGGLSDLETAFDYVVLVMDDYVGNHVGYPGYRTYSNSWNGDSVWQHMGYPGGLTSTQRPAFQGNCTISSTSSESLFGQTGKVLGMRRPKWYTGQRPAARSRCYARDCVHLAGRGDSQDPRTPGGCGACGGSRFQGPTFTCLRGVPPVRCATQDIEGDFPTVDDDMIDPIYPVHAYF